MSCFGKEINTEIQNLSKKLSNSDTVADSIFNETEDKTSETKMPEPCARSTPFISKNDKEKQKAGFYNFSNFLFFMNWAISKYLVVLCIFLEDVLKSKCPNVAKEQVSVGQTVASSVGQPEQYIKTSSEMKSHVHPSIPGNQKEQNNIEIGDSKSGKLVEDLFVYRLILNEI